MADDPADTELTALRKRARELGALRGEEPGTGHLLAALFDRAGVARELLAERGLDQASVLKAARSFAERRDGDDPVAAALGAAREVARRAAVPNERAFVSKHSGVARPGAPGPPGALHVLVALASGRRFAAHKLLTYCGVDVGMLCAAAMQALRAGAPSRPASTRAAQSESAAGGQRRLVVVPPDCRRPKAPEPAAAPVPAPAAHPPSRPASAPAPALLPPKPTPGHARAAPQRAGERAGIESLALDPGRFPVLAGLGKNLSLAAARGELDPVVGREPEVEQALDILAKRHANNPVLIGPAGVGKTSVARALAGRLAARAAEGQARVLVELPVSDLLAGTATRGSLAERTAAIRAEIRQAAGRVVLFVDDLHQLFGAAAEEIGAELKAALAAGDLPLVGATTTEQWRALVQDDPALQRRFTAVEVVEPNVEEAFLLLRTVTAGLAAHHGVRYSDEAIALCVSWSVRYMPGRALPDKAVSILDLAGARVGRHVSRARTGVRPVPTVEPQHVAEVVSELGDVPEERLLESDRDRLLRLEELLGERVVGHTEALGRIGAVLRRNAAGLRGRRPIGTFLLLGPTGVGKTETAKAIAAALFHCADAMTRLDMSEYSESHAVARLVGAPPGYVGHEAGGALTEAVRRRAYQVVLLDEIEKAHRDVLEAFLQVFDEGRLTDGRGRCVDFSNAVIVMTSNLGSAELAQAHTGRRLGFGASRRESSGERITEIAVRAARAALPPELYNRIDEVLVYQHLSRLEVERIADQLLASLAQSLEGRGVRLEVGAGVIGALLDAGGYEPELGARPLRRTIARLVEAPLAEMILRDELERGATAHVGVENGSIAVRAGRAARARSA
ncbi:MAG: ATP-dependent Clp protease ATP-binding subunit [Deltaproteobacteria bacterium]|nr:ATP-dependent Clp protease ATP-binding subunit [Deltaproteobacteria bacterium]